MTQRLVAVIFIAIGSLIESKKYMFVHLCSLIKLQVHALLQSALCDLVARKVAVISLSIDRTSPTDKTLM